VLRRSVRCDLSHAPSVEWMFSGSSGWTRIGKRPSFHAAGCTNTTPYNIGLDAGTGTGATVAARKMTNGANTITYSLYSDSGRTTVWGNTVGTNTVSATGNGASQTYTVYGRVPSQTTPAAATYTDTITVTVTY
jgi:spore coat protein U-like protein